MKKIIIIALFSMLNYSIEVEALTFVEYFSNNKIQEFINEKRIYKLTTIYKYNLNNIENLRSLSKTIDESGIFDDGYYVVYSDATKTKVEYILLFIESNIYTVYKYLYAGEKNTVSGIVVEQSNRLQATITMLDEKKYDKVIFSYSGSNMIREIIYCQSEKDHDKLIGFRLPDIENKAYEIHLKNGFYEKVICYNDYVQTFGDWGDVTIAPLPEGIFLNLSNWFPNTSNTDYFYVIDDFYPYISNIYLPRRVHFYIDNNKAYTVNCSYEQLSSDTIPLINELIIVSNDTKKSLVYIKTENGKYDVIYKSNEKAVTIEIIDFLNNNNVRDNISKYL